MKFMSYGNFNIIWSDTVDSTNDEAKRCIDSLPDLSVISTYNQTAGRGQRGNSWLSEPHANLTFSIVAKNGFNIKPADQIVINEMISLAIIDFLSCHGIDARIKWPNDIYVADKKICGILIEHVVRGNSIVYSIIGVGLNVNQKNFDSSLYNPTSILLETGEEQHSLPSLLEELLTIFNRYLEIYDRDEIGSLYHSKLRKINV